MGIWAPKYHISVNSQPLQGMSDPVSREGMKSCFSPPGTSHPFLPFESTVIHLLFLYRQKIIAKNEEIYQRYGRSPSLTVYEEDSDTVEDGSKKRQES